MQMVAALFALLVFAFPARAADPIVVALDAEFGIKNSTSAQSIQKGILTAVDEINRAGGVLGRPMELRVSDNRSVPMRGIENFRQHAADPSVVAVFGGRYSPVVIEVAPVAHELGMILMVPWASADAIIDENRKPAWVFRLSLRDEHAMPVMLRHAAAKGVKKVGLLLANTAWGRSNLASAERHMADVPGLQLAGKAWFNWGDASLLAAYRQLQAAGAQAILFVTNDVEGSLLVREMAALPAAERLPLVFHWGITGGTFVVQAGDALSKVDHSVVQTFSFRTSDRARVARVLETTGRMFGIHRAEAIEAPVGFAHAYDLTHILARAIALAGTTERAKVRDALEKVQDYQGLVRFYDRPFTPARHEALSAAEVFMARFRPDGVIEPLR